MKRETKLMQVVPAVLVVVVFSLVATPPLFAKSKRLLIPTEQIGKNLVPGSPSGESFKVVSAVGVALEGITDQTVIFPVRYANNRCLPPVDKDLGRFGFALANIFISDFFRSAENEARQYAGGIILHQDLLGRQVATRFEVSYKVSRNGAIVVDSTAVAPYEFPIPAVTLFFVPARRVTRAQLKSKNFTRLFEFALKNGVHRVTLRRRDRGRKKYYIFAFFMDRLARDAQVGLLVSKKAEGLSGDGKRSVVFQDKGWHVAYTRSTISLDANPEIFFKAMYTPGSNAPPEHRRKTVAGVFTSDSLTRQVQRLLAMRGYKPGPADGIMGKRTRSAVRKFQKDRGIKVDGAVSVPLVALLAGSDTPPVVSSPVGGPGRTGVPEWLKPKMWPNELSAP